MTSSVAIYFRDRFTWLAYFMLAYYAYFQASLGPAIPFLRGELGLSYTIAGLHLSAFAVGMMLAGLLGDRLARRFGRRLIFWAGALGMAVGAILLTAGRQPGTTIGAVLLMGTLGSLLLVMVQATLSDHHGDQRAVALTEANVAAGIAGVLAPLAIGSFAQAGIGWRGAFILPAAIVLLAAMGFRGVPVPEAPDLAVEGRQERSKAGGLLRIFWVYWGVLLLVVSIEWCVIFWGADFLETAVGFPRVTAAALMTVFWVAYVLGRAAGSRLTRSLPAETLLLVAFGLSLAGFPLFWLSPIPPLNVVGLFLVGLGFANLFPLTLAVGVGVAPEHANAASARISLGAGLAILITPLVLGALADGSSIGEAFAIELVLLVAATIGTYLANRLAAG